MSPPAATVTSVTAAVDDRDGGDRLLGEDLRGDRGYLLEDGEQRVLGDGEQSEPVHDGGDDDGVAVGGMHVLRSVGHGTGWTRTGGEVGIPGFSRIPAGRDTRSLHRTPAV